MELLLVRFGFMSGSVFIWMGGLVKGIVVEVEKDMRNRMRFCNCADMC